MITLSDLDRHLYSCSSIVVSYPIDLGARDYCDTVNDFTLVALVAASAFYISIDEEDRKRISDLKIKLAAFAYVLEKLSLLDISTDEDDIVHISMVDFGITDKFCKDIVVASYFPIYTPNSSCTSVNYTINKVHDSPIFKFDQHSIKNLRSYFKRMLSTKRDETLRILRNKVETTFGR